MKPAAYDGIAATEARQWWHRIRRLLAARLIASAGLPPGANALDLGCGTGGTLRIFQPLGVSRLVGIDRSERALYLARRHDAGALLLCGDASQPLPLPSEVFELATIFGVLNHEWIGDEKEPLRELHRVLRPGGLLFVTEPAFPSLMRNMDRMGMTRRRYRPGEIAGLARAAGFELVRDGHFAAWAFVPAWLVARLERRGASPAEADSVPVPVDWRMAPAWLEALCYALSRAEIAAIGLGLRFPVGLTYFGLFRKPY